MGIEMKSLDGSLHERNYPVSFLWLIGILAVAVIAGYGTATNAKLSMLGITGFVIVLAGLFWLKLGLYRQLLIFLALLEVFTFAIKVGYGLVNTTALALIPSAFVALMLAQVFLLVGEKKIRIRWTLIDVSVLAFFLLDLIQILNPHLDITRGQPYLSVGLRGFQQRSFLGLAYFVARGVVNSDRQFTAVARVLAYSIAINGLYALAQQLFGFTALELQHRQSVATDGFYTKRAVGFLSSPFTFGIVSAIGVLCSIYLLTSARLSWHQRFLAIASALVNILAVLLSGSRSTYLSLMMAVLLVARRLPWRWLFRSLWRARAAIVATIIVVVIVISLSGESIPLLRYSVERLISLGELSELFTRPSEVDDINFSVRRDLALVTLPLILQKPIGYGTGIFNGGSNPDGVIRVEGYATWIDNEFSSLALELGLLGVFLLVTIVVLAIRRCHRVARIPGQDDHAIALIALVAVCPIAGLGGQWLAAYPANVLFWVFAGIISNLPLDSPSAHTPASAESFPRAIGQTCQVSP